jgi:hypothetical protein
MLELLNNISTLGDFLKNCNFFAVFFPSAAMAAIDFWNWKQLFFTSRYVITLGLISCSLMGKKFVLNHHSSKTAFSEMLGWVLSNRTWYFIYTAVHPRMTQALSNNGVFGFQQRQTIWIQSLFRWNFHFVKVRPPFNLESTICL